MIFRHGDIEIHTTEYSNQRRYRVAETAVKAAMALLIFITVSGVFYSALYADVSAAQRKIMSAAGYMNLISDRLTELTGRIHDVYQDSGSHGSAVFATVAGELALLVISVLAVMKRGRIASVLMIAAVITGLVTGFIPASYWVMAFGIVMILTCICRNIVQADNISKYRTLIFSAGTAAAVALAVIGIILLAQAGPADIDGFKADIQDSMHKHKYESCTNPMPEGRLNDVGSFRYRDRIALQVSMSSGEKTYLKGFTGEVYENNQWKALKGKAVLKDSPLFFWLHKSGFYGQAQIAKAFEETGVEADNFVSVNNIGACRQYYYLPYGMKYSRLLDSRLIGDRNAVSDDAEATSDYMVKTVSAAPKDIYSLQKKLSKADGRYLDDEEAYRKSVYRNYTDVPDDIKDLLEAELGPSEKKGTVEAKKKILGYMNRNVDYREAVHPTDESKDFVVQFLGGSHKGYAVHYASAAVMMMRYYGIPARYVEGFIIPKGIAKAADDGVITVTQKYSHAWAEYYVDGAGWMPFETVPKYIDKDDKGLNGDGGGGASGTKQEQENKDNNKSNADNPLNRIGKVFVMNIPLLIGILLLIIAAFAAVTLKRRKGLKVFLATFTGDDRRQAVMNAFAYGIGLMKMAGVEINTSLLRDSREAVAEWLGSENGKLCESCIEINEKAKYSSEEISEEERETVREFTNRVSGKYVKTVGPIRKSADKVIRCIY